MPGPGAAAGAKAASTAAGRGAGARSGAKAAKSGGSSAAARKGAGKKGGGEAARARSLGRLTSFRARRQREPKGEGDLFSSRATGTLALVGGASLVFLIVVLIPAVLLGSSSGCGGEEDEAVPIRTNHRTDPENLSETQIAIRIYLVGKVMGMTGRQIVTAYATAYVESNMTNIYGGDSDSRGIYQQRNFSPWTDGGRNRNNIIDTSISFFLQLRKLDTGQSVGLLAAEVQQPAEQYRYRYALWVEESVDLYNRISRLIGSAAGVKSIQSLEGVTISGGFDSLALGAACAGFSATGPANLKTADMVYHPRSYKTLPSNLWDYRFGPPDQVDTRIWANVVWVLSTYRLKGTAGRETGHSTHGDGTAMDMIPANGNSIEVWDATARKLALDLGWTPGCAANGFARSAGGLCDFVPAIILVGYNNYEDGAHGDPNHTGSPHIHVSWYNSCYACGGGALVSPRDWVKVFPVGPTLDAPAIAGEAGARGGRKPNGETL